MRSRIACSAVLGAALAALCPQAARAEATATERAMADTLFKDAKNLLARGKVPEACEKLAASYRIDPAGGTLINLAKCHEIEGKTATAWTEYNVALAAAKKASRADREKAAREHMAALEPRLSRVTITLPAAAAGAAIEVKLDGVVVDATALGTAIPVDPGDHTATATAPERKPWEAKVSLKEAESRTLAVPALEAAAPPPPPPPPPRPWKLPVGIAAAAAGAVLIGVGTGFGVSAISLGSRANDACPHQVCTTSDGLQAASDGKTAANIANGTIVAGAVLAAGGAALLILNAVSGPAGREAKPAVSWRFVPAVGPGLGLLAAQGAF